MGLTACRLLPWLLLLVLVTVLAKPESKKVDKSRFPRYTGLARRMAAFVSKYATKFTLQLVKIRAVRETLRNGRVTTVNIKFYAKDKRCKRGDKRRPFERCSPYGFDAYSICDGTAKIRKGRKPKILTVACREKNSLPRASESYEVIEPIGSNASDE